VIQSTRGAVSDSDNDDNAAVADTMTSGEHPKVSDSAPIVIDSERYELIELLGRGGMGEVWKAYDTAMNRVVALKVLPGNLADDAQYQARFRREAQAAASLDEPHIVPIHDFGEIDGRLYVTMRLIDGKTISDLLVNGPLAPQRAVSIVEQIAAALGAAHRIGLVHRDVKPSNILVTEDDFAYLIDFGIARAAEATKLTSTGATIGTLAYMAPERFTTDRDDARADIYALTCVLHECLTGSQPFPGDSLERQISSHLTMPPPRPSTMQPGISPQMDQVIATGMAKSPDQRYATTRDLAVAARAALTAPLPQSQPAPPAFAPPPPATSWSAPVPYPATGPTAAAPASAATQYSTPAQFASWAPPAMPNAQQAQGQSPWWRNPAVLILAALVTFVLIVVAVVAVIVWPQMNSNDRPTATAQPSTQRIPSASSTKPSAPGTTSSAAVPTTATSAAPAGPSELQTAEGLGGLLDTMRNHFGDVMGFQLVVYPDYAITERVSPKNSHVEQDFMYRDGQWSGWGSDTTTSSFDILSDLSAFNVPAVAATLAGAPQALGASDGSKTYLIVEGAEGGSLELAIHSAEPGTGYMQVNPDGSVKKVFPP
jgi:serine/threonine protein kinase